MAVHVAVRLCVNLYVDVKIMIIFIPHVDSSELVSLTKWIARIVCENLPCLTHSKAAC